MRNSYVCIKNLHLKYKYYVYISLIYCTSTLDEYNKSICNKGTFHDIYL